MRARPSWFLLGEDTLSVPQRLGEVGNGFDFHNKSVVQDFPNSFWPRDLHRGVRGFFQFLSEIPTKRVLNSGLLGQLFPSTELVVGMGFSPLEMEFENQEGPFSFVFVKMLGKL